MNSESYKDGEASRPCVPQQEGAAAAEFRGAWHADGLPDAAALVFSTFELLFPDTFQRILPVHKHKVPARTPLCKELIMQSGKKSWAWSILSCHICGPPCPPACLCSVGFLVTVFPGTAQHAGQVGLQSGWYVVGGGSAAAKVGYGLGCPGQRRV